MKNWYTSLLVMFVSIVSAQTNFNLTELAHIDLGELTNDVWGFVDDEGREYGIVGTRSQSIIYDLSNPVNPEVVARIPGAASIWRDFKSFGNYIYLVADQGSDGMTIIDLTNAPDSISHTFWKPNLTFDGSTGTLRTCHNLYIDEDLGHAYLAGCNIGQRGAIIVDIKTDPMNPSMIGAENERYAHDVYVRDNILYASEINDGNLGIYDISDVSDVKLISRTRTTSRFTHNAWLSDDSKFIFTTDERPNSFVDAYDITDLSRPVLVDTYQPVDGGGGVIPHNVHVLNDFIIASWYVEGVVIIDAKQPDNLIRVGQYDTSPQNLNGCWGAFPFLPSGLVLASDLETGFFVLEPNYQRAAYLRGVVTDAATGNAINGATITIENIDVTTRSSANGSFKTGFPISRPAEITISKDEFKTATVMVDLTQGESTLLNVALESSQSFNVLGNVVNSAAESISGATIIATSEEGVTELIADENGLFAATLPQGEYEILAAAWGFKGIKMNLSLAESQSITINLEEGIQDDFFADLGWTVSGDANSGLWTRAIPLPTFANGITANPDMDTPDDIGSKCFVTGNDNTNSTSGDVDGGITILTSPIVNLEGMERPIIEYDLWFFNGNSGSSVSPNDKIDVYLTFPGGEALVETVIDSVIDLPTWMMNRQIDIRDFVADATMIQFQLEVSDDDAGHIVEAGLDAFSVFDAGLSTSIADVVLDRFDVFPSPASDFISIKTKEGITQISIYDLKGRLLSQFVPRSERINVADLSDGLYIIKAQVVTGGELVSQFVIGR